jgi:branched-chain amino acid transport system substrate-binding protein
MTSLVETRGRWPARRRELPPLDPPRLLSIPARAGNREVVRIGVSGNLGGHTRELCAGCAVAVEQWVERDDPKLDVDLVWAEDFFEASRTLATAAGLVEAGVVAVVGHLSSSAALPAADVYREAGVPSLAPGTSNGNLTCSRNWHVLRLCGRDEDLAARMAHAAVEAGCQTVTVLEQPIVYGRTLGRLLTRVLLESGLVVRRMPLDTEQPSDAEAIVEGVDGVLFAATYQAVATVLPTLRECGFAGAIVLGDDCFTPELPLLAGPAATGALVVSTPLETDRPEYRAFRRKYARRAGLEPGAYSASSFFAASLVLEELDVLLARGARQFVTTVKTRASRPTSLLGPLQFDPYGNVSQFRWTTYRISDGEFGRVHPFEEV